MTKSNSENLQNEMTAKSFLADGIATELSQRMAFIADYAKHDPDYAKELRLERFKTVVDDLKEHDPNYAQQTLAKELGVSAPSLSLILKGKRGITADFAAKVHARYPQYPVEWLLGLSLYANEQEKKSGNAFAYSLHDEWTFDFIEAVSGVNFRPGPHLSALPYELPDDPENARRGYKINGGYYSLSDDEVRNLLKEIRAFVNFKVDYISKTKENLSERGFYDYEEALEMFVNELLENASKIEEMKKRDPEKAKEAVVDIWKKYLFYYPDLAPRMISDTLDHMGKKSFPKSIMELFNP